MRARRGVDHGLTTTTESRIESMIGEAERLRGEYRTSAALQRAPYFEILTERFSLIVVDTGIQRRVDADQMRWLEAALVRAGDRFRMVILGHPLYAAGRYQAESDNEFSRIHALLRQHRVDVVMAGDTHDFEFYREPCADQDKSHAMYHFVNGGGGAYLSIGTALDWPKQPPVEQCGFYPRTDALAARLDAYTPAWRLPFWYWVKYLGAWPSSPETASAAFDFDRAPFFQSFMEIRVDGSSDTVRLWLYGSNGRLKWRDLFVQNDQIPEGGSPDELVEFVFPLH